MTLSNTTKGLLLGLLGYFATASLSATAKALPSNISIFTVIFFQFAIPFIFIAPKILRQGIKPLKPQRPGLLLTRAINTFSMLICIILSVKHIPLVDSILLQNTTPFFLPLLVLIFFKKVMPQKLWVGIIIGFIGLFFILKPGVDIFNPFALVALLSGVLSAGTFIIISSLKKTEPNERILFYCFLPGALATLPLMLTHWVPLNRYDIILLIASGICMYLSQALITHAFSYIKASLLAPFCYSTVVFGGILEWIFWGVIPDELSFLGILLVCVGGIVTLILENQNNKKTLRETRQNDTRNAVFK